MTQTIEQLIERLNAVREGMEVGLDDWPTASQIWEYREAVKTIEQLTARVRELEQQRDELAKALSLAIDCWECEAFLTDEVVNISRVALSVFEG